MGSGSRRGVTVGENSWFRISYMGWGYEQVGGVGGGGL